MVNQEEIIKNLASKFGNVAEAEIRLNHIIRIIHCKNSDLNQYTKEKKIKENVLAVAEICKYHNLGIDGLKYFERIYSDPRTKTYRIFNEFSAVEKALQISKNSTPEKKPLVKKRVENIVQQEFMGIPLNYRPLQMHKLFAILAAIDIQ